MKVDVPSALSPNSADWPPCHRFRLWPISWKVVDARTYGRPTNSSHSPSVTIALPPGRSAMPDAVDGRWKPGLGDRPSLSEHIPFTAPTGVSLASTHGSGDVGLPRACAYIT